MQFCIAIYEVTQGFPQNEMYGLTSQIRRSSISIPSNIAEGNTRGYTAEYLHFLQIAFGSGAEIETQLLLAVKIGYINEDNYLKLNKEINSVMKMLNKLIRNIKTSA